MFSIFCCKIFVSIFRCKIIQKFQKNRIGLLKKKIIEILKPFDEVHPFSPIKLIICMTSEYCGPMRQISQLRPN